MQWCAGWRALSAAAPTGLQRVVRPALALAAAFALANCTMDGKQDLSAAQPQGASVAFESIDGPPPARFKRLVEDLNSEAQNRRLAVTSREQPSAYRVRGYLAAKQVKGRTTISWVWDVFDGDERRAYRISGEETTRDRHRDAWSAADDAMLQRIARASMDQLAVFLNAGATGSTPEPSTAPAASTFVSDSSPEAAGIYQIVPAKADPFDADSAGPAHAAAVPLPPRRPQPADTAVSASASMASSS